MENENKLGRASSRVDSETERLRLREALDQAGWPKTFDDAAMTAPTFIPWDQLYDNIFRRTDPTRFGTKSVK